MRVRLLKPVFGTAAGDVLEIADVLGADLVEAGDAEVTSAPVAPWQDPPPTGYAAMEFEDLRLEAVRRGIDPWMMGLPEIVSALELSDRAGGG